MLAEFVSQGYLNFPNGLKLAAEMLVFWILFSQPSPSLSSNSVSDTESSLPKAASAAAAARAWSAAAASAAARSAAAPVRQCLGASYMGRMTYAGDSSKVSYPCLPQCESLQEVSKQPPLVLEVTWAGAPILHPSSLPHKGDLLLLGECYIMHARDSHHLINIK